MTISRLSYSAASNGSKGSYTSVSKLEKRLLDRIEPLFEIVVDEWASQTVLSYSRLPDGSALIGRVSGRTARALYLEHGVTQLSGLLPIDLWQSPVWEGWDESSQLPPMSGPSPRLPELVGYALRMEEVMPGRLERFLADVRALFAPSPGRQIVVITDSPSDVVCLVRIACASLPTRLAARLTFTTHCTDPHVAFQQIVGTKPGSARAFTEAEARHQYRVHDLDRVGVESPAAETPDPWARRLTAEWFNGGFTPEHAARLWLPPDAGTAERPTTMPAKPREVRVKHGVEPDRHRGQELEDVRARESAAAARLSVSGVDKLARAGVWQLPPARTVDPTPLFEALKTPAENAARALAEVADAELSRITAEAAQSLGSRLRADAGFVAACEGPLADLRDGRLLAAALRDLEQVARVEPRGMLTGFGFRAMANGPLGELIPQDCGSLRFLIATVRQQLADSAVGPVPAGPAHIDPDASARTIQRLMRAARIEPDHGGGFTLATVLSLYWPRPAVVPVHAATEITAGLRKKNRTITDDEVLDRLAEAVLMAPVVDDAVVDLADWLLLFQLSTRQTGALTVLVVAAGFKREELSPAWVRDTLRHIHKSLRDGDSVPRSAAVKQWWVDRTINVLFHSVVDELWIGAVPELALCNDALLLRRYEERVREPGGPIEALTRDPEVVDRAVTAWKQAPEENHHWSATRADLLKWADRMRKENGRPKTRRSFRPDRTG